MTNQKTIKVDRNLLAIVFEYLKSDDAKNQGFTSMSQIATEAIREFMDQKTGDKLSYGSLVDIVKQQRQLLEMMKKTSKKVDEHIEHVKKLEIFYMETNFPGINLED